MRKPYTVTGSITLHGMDLDYVGTFTPGDPGRYSGPPEDCYPSEAAEVEVLKLNCGEADAMFLLDSAFGEEISESIIEKEFDEKEEEAEEDEDEWEDEEEDDLP